MRIAEATPTSIASAAARLAALGFLAFAVQAANAQGSGQAAQEDEEARATYEWSAELVSFDEDSRTAVVRARVEPHALIDNLDELSEGDRLILVWSGRIWAAGVFDLEADPELTPGTLSLPVEFVSSERDGRYVNVRINVPDEAVDTISGFEPGMRITGVSPKMATEWSMSVESIRHYNDVS